MRRIVVATLAALAIALPAGVWASREALDDLLPGNALEGSRLFAARGCVECHAVHGDGGTGGPDLGRLRVKRPLLELAAVMWNHAPLAGPARPTFTPDEMASVLAFVYSLGHVEGPGDPRAGARLFQAKGCRACHAVAGVGGARGPALDPYSRYASPLFVTAALWKHGPAMEEAMRERAVPRPRFTGSDIVDLMAFLRAAGTGSERVYARAGDPVRGSELFSDKKCLECHAIRGEGGAVGPDLGRFGQLRGSLTEIAGRMWNHGPVMWERMAKQGLDVPDLGVEEMADLVSYLYYLQFLDRPGDPARGRLVLQERGCASCHAADGSAQRGPALADSAAVSTPLGVVTAMWNHGPTSDQGPSGPGKRPMLGARDVADVVAALRGPAGNAPPTGGEPGRTR